MIRVVVVSVRDARSSAETSRVLEGLRGESVVLSFVTWSHIEHSSDAHTVVVGPDRSRLPPGDSSLARLARVLALQWRAGRFGAKVARNGAARETIAMADLVVAEHVTAVYPVWQTQRINSQAPLISGLTAAQPVVRELLGN